ncbi:peptide ABC transporter permease [Aquamicrobium soli]|jgi:hypothetical protein|uniref:Peptide ABC transporter permease n=1 Tax=Aquamicrobium soli TaxID=1811518 RepID=A0ABV7K3Y3_9HYPH
MAEGPDPEQRRQNISAQNARQGEIILRTRARRIIFIAGLAGAVVLALLVSFFGHG